ncbi:MAG: hypothetical protein HKN33_00990 [Pyrinomonadaceae bacterium]|nr:hypothetical protein [Pyrinomonadaceae bacterium]
MNRLKRSISFALVLFSAVSFLAVSAHARGGNEFDAVCDHLEEEYDAKKVKIPFMWLARFAVGVVRPAGVKAFKVTIYKNLKFTPERLNEEMKTTMRDSFSDEWSPILRVRSEKGEHVYMNIREAGKNVKILLVTIQKDEAVVVRAKFNPDKLASFLENPRIFGISLSERKDKKREVEFEDEPDVKENAEPEIFVDSEGNS